MLPAAVYHCLYDEVRRLPDLDIVEVGGASGAASVVISRAMIESGKTSRLVVVEKCEGGSRTPFGSRERNLARLQAHLDRFGARNVAIFPEELTFENGAEVLSLLGTPEIGALVLDADGRIDRDFFHFWPRLCPGGLLVVDDAVELRDFRPRSPRHPDGGTKFLLTARLLQQFVRWGLFEPRRRVRNTLFGRKPEGADFSRFDRAVCERIVAEVEEEWEAWNRTRGSIP
jgi:predicted O-methyltransferase YrrM